MELNIRKSRESRGRAKGGSFFVRKRNKKRQTENLTATTTYPCFGQDLGDSAGAGSSDLPMQR